MGLKQPGRGVRPLTRIWHRG
jgi:hypothetical protein